MRYVRYWISAALLLALLSPGCRMPGGPGPVPQSLTDCRRLSQKGLAALERGEQPKAETLLAQAVTACPVDAEARRHYAEAPGRRVRRAGGHDPVGGSLPAGRGRCFALGTPGRDAAGQRSAGIGPKSRRDGANPRSQVGKCLGGSRRGDAGGGPAADALADYLHALSYAPNDRAILREIAELHRQLNQPDRALQALQSLAETYPAGEEPGQVLYLTGLAYVALGRYDDGVENLSAAGTAGSLQRKCCSSLAKPNWWPATGRRLPKPRDKPWPWSRSIKAAAICSSGSNWPSSRKTPCKGSGIYPLVGVAAVRRRFTTFSVAQPPSAVPTDSPSQGRPRHILKWLDAGFQARFE